jgi:hypothetical protein
MIRLSVKSKQGEGLAMTTNEYTKPSGRRSRTFLALAVAPALAAAVMVLGPTGGAGASTSTTATDTTAALVAPPPNAAGCYVDHSGKWARTSCASQTYIKQHIPRPEVLSGVGGKASPVKAPPFVLSVVSAHVLAGGSDVDSHYGAGHYSLQNNVMFHGSNGHLDGVQFTDQSGGGLDNLCVWQVDVTTQTYTPMCLPLPISTRVVAVEGWSDSGLLSDMMQTTAGPAGVVVVPDLYGLGSKGRWNNDSGSVLGLGNGSKAVFSATEERIGVEATVCMNKAGFINFTNSCQSKPLQPLAYTGYTPGSLTYGVNTVETNNLIPVIGSPPAHLPALSYPNKYTASISYVASTTGKCFARTPPNC